MLLLHNRSCRTQIIVCTAWKSGPSRQAKSATFSTLAPKAFKPNAQIPRVCTSFIIITSVQMPFAAVVYTSRCCTVISRIDGLFVEEKCTPLLHSTSLPLWLHSLLTPFAVPQCGRLFPSPFPILKNCLPVSYFLVSPASFYLSLKSFCFLQVPHLSSSFSCHFLPSDQNLSPSIKAILASVISQKLSHSF